MEIKVNHAEESVAIRTIFPEDAFNAWAVMTRDRGGHYAAAPEVEGWTDVPVPEPAAPEDPPADPAPPADEAPADEAGEPAEPRQATAKRGSRGGSK